MLNMPTAERTPEVTKSMLEQMGTYSQEHKRYNSLFHQIKRKITKKSLASGYLSHSTFPAPPPFSTCLDPPPYNE